MRFTEDGLPLAWGSSREFFFLLSLRLTTVGSGAMHKLRPSFQLSAKTAGGGHCPLRGLQTEVPLSIQTAARSRDSKLLRAEVQLPMVGFSHVRTEAREPPKCGVTEVQTTSGRGTASYKGNQTRGLQSL